MREKKTEKHKKDHILSLRNRLFLSNHKNLKAFVKVSKLKFQTLHTRKSQGGFTVKWFHRCKNYQVVLLKNDIPFIF